MSLIYQWLRNEIQGHRGGNGPPSSNLKITSFPHRQLRRSRQTIQSGSALWGDQQQGGPALPYIHENMDLCTVTKYSHHFNRKIHLTMTQNIHTFLFGI